MKTADVERALMRMSGIVHKIELDRSETFSSMSGGEVYLKCENRQKTGSFKVRGAYNKISALRESGWSGNTVVACSAGNHAQGVAYAAGRLGCTATIVMPQTAPIAKIAATEGYGAKVVLHGNYYDETYEKALELVENNGAVLIPAFDDEDIIAGQGTVALEILRELPDTDIIMAPCGGGGLLAGIAAYAKRVNPKIKIIGVQAEGANAVATSFANKTWAQSEKVSTIADGIAVKIPGKQTVDLILRYVDEMVTVSDSEIAAAILLLIERCKEIVEPAGAAATAALLSKKADVAGKKVVCVLSGGNIDVEFIQRILERGLVQRGRRLQFKTVLPDHPGSLEQLCNIISVNKGNILTLEHDRFSSVLNLNQAVVHITLEVGGPKHGEKLLAALKDAEYTVIID